MTTDCNLTEMEMHSHIAPLTRLGGVRLCVMDGRDVLLDRMKIPAEKVDQVAQAVNEMFPTDEAHLNQVLQIVLGYGEGNLLVVAYKRLRLAVFHTRTRELDTIARSAHRVVQELGDSYERSGYRYVQSQTFGERHRVQIIDTDAIALSAEDDMMDPPGPAPFPPRPGQSGHSGELQTVPIRPSKGRLGTPEELEDED